MTKRFCDICGEPAVIDLKVTVTSGKEPCIALSTHFYIPTTPRLEVPDLCEQCRNRMVKELAANLPPLSQT